MLIYSNYEKYIDEYIEKNKGFFELYEMGKGDKKYIINFVPMGLDIETYTQYITEDLVKHGNVIKKVVAHYTNTYIWQFGFANYNFAGRTWEEFHTLLELIKKKICLGRKYKTFFFIHNAGFEFANMSKQLLVFGHKLEVFAREKRHPLRIEIDNSIIILDSAVIPGYSLKKLAENITRKTQKAVGDLDYSIPRNRFTKLTPEEEGYCENDVRILVEYAQYYKENYIDIDHPYMPLTSTMIANRVLKNKIAELKAQKKVTYMMMECYPKSLGQYLYIMQFFSGAYTHGNLYNLFHVVEKARGRDVCSLYPFVSMSFGGFPISRFKPVRLERLKEDYLKTHCCLCKCTFTNIKQRYGITILSKHKAYDYDNHLCKWDNGRLWECTGSITFFLTEIDLKTLYKFYTWDDLKIPEMLAAKRGYLPDYYRLAIADLYSKKCLLKGVEGKEVEYMNSKANLNSLSYGAMACKLNTTELYYTDDWEVKEAELDFNKLQYTKDKSPAWAIYVTSVARSITLGAIYEICKLGKDSSKLFIYSDTDSVKHIDVPEIDKIFNRINAKTRKNNEKWINDLGLKNLYPEVDFAEMGTFDDEGKIDKIKCLGAKRYLVEVDGKLKSTVAGLPKGTFEKACRDKKIKDPFFYFSDALFFNEIESEKLTAYYEDEEKEFDVVDLQGNVEHCHTYSYLSLIPTTFYMGIDQQLLMLYYENLNDALLEKKV